MGGEGGGVGGGDTESDADEGPGVAEGLGVAGGLRVAEGSGAGGSYCHDCKLSFKSSHALSVHLMVSCVCV